MIYLIFFIVKYKFPYSSTKQYLKRYLKKKLQLISEYNWFWILWNVFNKNSRVINQAKIDAKKNLILSHYKNHFPALIQLLNQMKKNQLSNIVSNITSII